MSATRKQQFDPPRFSRSRLRLSSALVPALGMMAGVWVLTAPSMGAAQCSVTGSSTTVGQVTYLGPSAVVDCPAGTLESRSFLGPDLGRLPDSINKSPAEDLKLTVRPNATLSGSTAQDSNTAPVVFAGTGSVIEVQHEGSINTFHTSQGGIAIAGTGGRVVVNQLGGKKGHISTRAEAINGSLFAAPADGWHIQNLGVITTRADNDSATIRTGTNATLENYASGLIRRQSTGPGGAFGPAIVAVRLGDGSTLKNDGTIEVTSRGVNVGSVVNLLGNSQLTNSGTIKLDGPGTGSAVVVTKPTGTSQAPTTITNEASGIIDARTGKWAVNVGKGSGNAITNRGTILGGTGGGIRNVGEDFRYVHAADAKIEGDVRAEVLERRVKAQFQGVARCTGSNAPVACFENVYNHPKTATIEVVSNKTVSFDPAKTELFGFSRIVLSGTGTLKLGQDFEGGDRQGPGTSPTGHFRQFLTFNVQDADGTIDLAGSISDSASGNRAIVNKIGDGTLRLTGDSTFTGNFSVIGGIVDVDGTLASRTNVKIGAGLTGSGEIKNRLNLEGGARIASDGKTEVLTVGSLHTDSGSVIQIDANENGGGLSSDRIDVKGVATFDGNTTLDAVFDANAKLPALQGITVVEADKGLAGTAPSVTLDPASLPHGQNFHLNLEALNITGATGPSPYVGPGQKLPPLTGNTGVISLQIINDDPNFVTPPQVTVINGPYQVPHAQPQLNPQRVPQLIPAKTPYLAPSLIKGATSQVTTPVVKHGKTPAKTGIRVTGGGGVQLGGGTLIPQPQTAGGGQTPAHTIPIGNVNHVVVVEPPKNITTNFVSVVGSYGKVDQTHAGVGSKYALLYTPHSVSVANIPNAYGNLRPLGVTQTTTQQQVGNALDNLLPQAHARPTSASQAQLVAGLYPQSLQQINDTLDSIAGTDADPTFVTVLNNRIFQNAIQSRLGDLRADDPAPAVTQGGHVSDPGRYAWGELVGRYAESDSYLGGADLRTWGIILGADQMLDSGIRVGAGLAYTDTSVDMDSGANDSVSNLELGVYGSWEQNGWFANGTLGVGYHRLDLDRVVNNGSQNIALSGSADARSFFAGIEAGRVIPTSFGAIEPAAALRYMYVDRDGYTETGSDVLARDVSGTTLNAGQAILGIRGYGTIVGRNGTIWRPEASIGYAREIGDTNINETASLIGAPGSSFPVITAGPGDDAGFVHLRLSSQKGRGTFFVDYAADVRDDFVSQTFSAGFSMSF